MALQTEFDFTLPKGFVGRDGTLHRRGVMRLSTARDEIEPLRDPRITGPDDPYLTILVIARVVTELGTLDDITPREVEGLFAADLAFLQDLYGIINFGDPADAAALQRAVLPVDEEPEPVIEAEPEPAPAEEPAPAAKSDKPVSSAPRRRGRIEEITPTAES
ncbi:MAG: hypothetical protein ABMA25_08610 [Ilumatobacteraceae bacterium]